MTLSEYAMPISLVRERSRGVKFSVENVTWNLVSQVSAGAPLGVVCGLKQQVYGLAASSATWDSGIPVFPPGRLLLCKSLDV